jgi:hypothetical protein
MLEHYHERFVGDRQRRPGHAGTVILRIHPAKPKATDGEQFMADWRRVSVTNLIDGATRLGLEGKVEADAEGRAFSRVQRIRSG